MRDHDPDREKWTQWGHKDSSMCITERVRQSVIKHSLQLRGLAKSEHQSVWPS